MQDEKMSEYSNICFILCVPFCFYENAYTLYTLTRVAAFSRSTNKGKITFVKFVFNFLINLCISDGESVITKKQKKQKTNTINGIIKSKKSLIRVF